MSVPDLSAVSRSSPGATADAYLYEPLASSARSQGAPVSMRRTPSALGTSAAIRTNRTAPNQAASTAPTASNAPTMVRVRSSPSHGISTKPAASDPVTAPNVLIAYTDPIALGGASAPAANCRPSGNTALIARAIGRIVNDTVIAWPTMEISAELAKSAATCCGSDVPAAVDAHADAT